MAYLVLARKYRPERFADMVGQEHIARVLGQAIEQERTHHAYLFCGVRGLGKTSAARILARCMVCEQGPTATPCNVCEQCMAVTESRSVDVREIDGASHNSVDDIRALREQVHYLPQSARKKIYIIDEVHMLTTSAFNALLKTLEEPPEHVLFIFATTDPHKVLPTILSRVSRLDFRRVGTDALAQHLSNILDKEGAKAEPEALRIVAQSGEGSVRDALTQMDKILAFCADRSAISTTEVRAILGRADPHALSDILDAVLARDVQTMLDKLDEVMAQGADARNISLGLLRELRNLVVLRVTSNAQALVDENPARFASMQARAQNCETQQLSQLFDRLMRSTERLDRAPSPRLALEMALIELAIAPSLCDISSAIAHLGGSTGGSTPVSSGGPPSNGAGTSRAGGSSNHKLSSSPAPSPSQHQAPRPQPPTPREDPSAAAPKGPPAQAAPDRSTTSLPSSIPDPAPAKPNAAPEIDSMPAPDPEGTPNLAVSAPVETRAPESRTPPAPSQADPPPRSALANELWRMVKDSKTPKQNSAKAGQAPGPVSPAAPGPSPGPSAAGNPARTTTRTSGPQVTQTTQPRASQLEQGAASQAIDFEPTPSLLRWIKMLDRLRAREESMMLAMLSDIGVVELQDDAVVLTASPGNFSRQKLQSKGSSQDSFFAWLQEEGFRPEQVQWKDQAPQLPGAPSWSLFTANARAQHREKVVKEAHQHEGVKMMMEQMDAKVLGIRVLRDHRNQPFDPPFER